jgi:DNA polymerase I-like protein with 3'-5' exonuclease and polymerase domains
LENSNDVWGFVSPDWLQEQIKKWGHQTHHIQLRAAIVLKEITANGLHLDLSRREELVVNLQQVLDTKRKELAAHGYLPGKGSAKALQGIFMRLQRGQPDMNFPKTDTGLFSTSYDAIFELAATVPFIKELLEFRETEKMLNSFLDKMARPVLHPSFNVLVRTGRTTSFGDINAQNLPTDERVRSCFVPLSGNVYIDADYATIELATLAQTCMSQFQLKSGMAAAINAGKDLHTLIASRVTGKTEADVTKAERKNAKAINFGKPGGMGSSTLKLYAKATYGVELDDAEVEALSAAWFEMFPEMEEFLGDGTDLGLEVARLLELTPASHHEHTGSERFIDHPANAGRADLAHPILGGMALKVFKAPNPTTRDGAAYLACDVDYFWSQLDAHRDLLPAKLRAAVVNRQPSPQLQKAVMSLVGRAGVFTLTGRLRAEASYCARHNTVFQGLAADGAKLALWMLWRAGYRIVNFIHDQFLIEVPADSDLKFHAENIKRLMIEGMKQVVPDLLVGVSYAATDRWWKEAAAIYDASGNQLLIWQPKPKPGIAEPKSAA